MAYRAMIADDAAIMRTLIRNALTDNGFEVVAEAADGVEAVDRYREVVPDVVTIDIVMPRMDGINAVKNIIADHPDAKIVVCSSLGQQAQVVEAIRAGAKGFVTKPFDAPTLVESLRRVLA